MKTHRLKCWPEYLAKVRTGEKPFEIRWNDRDYEVGDRLMLDAWNPMTEEYELRGVTVDVLYLLQGEGDMGIEKGWVVMGVRVIGEWGWALEARL